MLDIIINFLVGVPPGVDLALWPLLIPLIASGVSAAGSYLGRPRQSQASQQADQAQADYTRYLMGRQQRMDPMHEALIRMSSGMLPTYAQEQYGFNNWSGLGGSNGDAGSFGGRRNPYDSPGYNIGRRAIPRSAMQPPPGNY